MSRIDKALQTWEKSARLADAVAEPTAHDAHGSAAPGLSGYARESVSPSGSAPSPRPSAFVATPANQTAGVSRPFIARPKAPPDLEARLVNGGSGAVPLEQYRRLAATLHDVQQQQGLRTLMVTSALPGEGKTLTTVNLALTLSDSYDRSVLVIDADLRWPSVHKVLGLANDVGLSDALQADDVTLSFKAVSPRLTVLTAGSTDRAPLAGLTSVRMASLIEQCANQFDWVVLDTPPVGLLPDAQLLARLTRASIFVIAAGITPQVAVTRAVAELGSECIVGTVLNRVSERQIPQAGYYSRYYQTPSDSE